MFLSSFSVQSSSVVSALCRCLCAQYRTSARGLQYPSHMHNLCASFHRYLHLSTPNPAPILADIYRHRQPAQLSAVGQIDGFGTARRSRRGTVPTRPTPPQGGRQRGGRIVIILRRGVGQVQHSAYFAYYPRTFLRFCTSAPLGAIQRTAAKPCRAAGVGGWTGTARACGVGVVWGYRVYVDRHPCACARGGARAYASGRIAGWCFRKGIQLGVPN